MVGLAKKLLAAFLAGGLMVSAAWAGASLLPTSGNTHKVTTAVPSLTEPTPAPTAAPATDPAQAAAKLPPPPPDSGRLADGQVLAGAARLSIKPRPQDYGGTWETSKEKCSTLSESAFNQIMDDPVGTGDHLASTGSPWPENPNCIYMGGFGIGPLNLVSTWGYFWDYANSATTAASSSSPPSSPATTPSASRRTNRLAKQVLRSYYLVREPY